MLEWRQVVSIQYLKKKAERNSYDVIEIDIYEFGYIAEISFLRIFYFLSINSEKNYAEPDIGKIFETNIIWITKYLNLNWNFFF